MRTIRMLLLLPGVIIILADYGTSQPTTLLRNKRADYNQFLTTHVISPETRNRLMSQNEAGRKTMLQNMFAGIRDTRIRECGNDPGCKKAVKKNNYAGRERHTFIVGRDKDVTNSIRRSNKNVLAVPPPRGRHQGSPLWKSNKAFPKLEAGSLNTFRETNGPFAAAVDADRRPTHYQGRYRFQGTQKRNRW